HAPRRGRRAGRGRRGVLGAAAPVHAGTAQRAARPPPHVTRSRLVMTLPPLQIPSLRPELLGAPFPGTEVPDLTSDHSQVEAWICPCVVRVSGRACRGVAWPDRPDFRPIYGLVSYITGAAGIAWYSMTAADATCGTAHLERASRAAAF